MSTQVDRITETHPGRLRSVLTGPRHSVPLIFYTLLLVAVVEVSTAVFGPMLVGDNVYLRAYLNDIAERNTREFATDGDQFLMYDSLTGWKNKPNASKGLWSVDEFGSRTNHPITIERTKPIRILALGNSLMNGGVNIDINETITALLEDSVTEALNFATMLYALDQMYLDYVHRLYRYQPDIVIVGLSSSPIEALSSRYVPFHVPGEVNMPYVKPRFDLIGDSLHLIQVPSRDFYSRVLDDPTLLSEFKNTDKYSPEFESYKRFGLTPVMYAARAAIHRFCNVERAFQEDGNGFHLMAAVMHALTREAGKHGVEVLFVVMPELSVTSPDRVRGMLPDQYGQMVKKLKAGGFEILDIRPVFRGATGTAASLYKPDGVHFSVAGNRLIAGAIRKWLATSSHIGADNSERKISFSDQHRF